MKRTIIYILSLVLAAGILLACAGCGGPNPPIVEKTFDGTEPSQWENFGSRQTAHKKMPFSALKGDSWDALVGGSIKIKPDIDIPGFDWLSWISLELKAEYRWGQQNLLGPSSEPVDKGHSIQFRIRAPRDHWTFKIEGKNYSVSLFNLEDASAIEWDYIIYDENGREVISTTVPTTTTTTSTITTTMTTTSTITTTMTTRKPTTEALLNGYNVYRYSNGTYKGYWKNGKEHGTGTMEWDDGDVYTGEWMNGERTNGTYKWPNGDEYTGGFSNNKLHGKGIKKWADGGVYDGDWVMDEEHGKGTYKWADGDVYTGDFLNNKRTGQGTYKYANGRSYVGGVLNGEFHGEGKYTFTDGRYYLCTWVNGETISEPRCYNKDGTPGNFTITWN